MLTIRQGKSEKDRLCYSVAPNQHYFWTACRVMNQGFTQSINSLHSWSGLLSGWVLFAVFLTGTLTVFDNEITAWMQPELQEVTSALMRERAPDPGYRVRPAMLAVRQPGEGSITDLPVLKVKWQENRTFSGQTIDPLTGQLVTYRDTQGGDFFYHFHYELLLGQPGAWIVGASGVAMLVALFTGLVIHRRIFKDFFSFRSQSFPYRAWLDTHNITGVLATPFHLMITFTGLVVLWSIYLSAGLPISSQEDSGMAPVQHAFDVQDMTSDRAAPVLVGLADGLTGDRPPAQSPVGETSQSLLFDLHFAQFGSAAIRWVYFILGLTSSIMIATSLLSWTTKRRRYDMSRPRAMHTRLMESLNVAAVAGLLVAIGAFLWANRLLPLPLPGRASWEVRCFFLAWGFCLMHSLLRGGNTFAWKRQLSVAALLLGSLPLLNAFTTKSHLLVSVPRGQWAVAGVDLTALAAGVLLGWMVRRLGQDSPEQSHRQVSSAISPDVESEQL
ncbi:membrane protein [Nitrospira sp. KM1]|uniref:PepSY-associated TM helix domain-containing protein n=1 Tax=Nitrospira sp. KM1 TaxID=1936990 RepID=UPI0013A7887D|nr:PepSY-associated TM helix domain-containing protein [Nitrospira sp. KM1]BCA56558.1 membrane protein [Nitrospira sp. KM1]